MKNRFSRRDFLARGTAVVGAVILCEVVMGVGVGEMSAVEALAYEESKEKAMPHVSVKFFPGRSEAVKQRLADAIAKDVVEIVGCDEASVSVTIEEIPSGTWKEKVYEPDIRAKKDHLYKKPGYSM